MVSMPVAWLISVFALLLTAIVLRQVRMPTFARVLFGLGLISIAVVAVFVGIRFQFNDPAFIVLQPYLAAITAPSLWLGFRTLKCVPDRGAIGIVVGTILASWFLTTLPFSWSASLAVILVNIFFTVRLFQLLRVPSEAFVHIAIQTHPTVRIAIIGCMAFLLLVIVIDTSVLATGLAAGEALAMGILSDAAFTIVLIITLGVFAGVSLAIGQSKPMKECEGGKILPDEADHAVLARLDTLMEEAALFRDPEITVARLGRRLGVPARTVSAAVNRVTGQNTSRYINAYRVKHAAHLLESSDLSVTDVMLEAGFISKSSFNTEFRRTTGRTPTEYRRTLPFENS